MRTSDLAKSVGISVQQVRNYVDIGILPPVDRTESGYRIFTERHAEALTVVRKMIGGHGWHATRTIMCAVHDDDLDTALAALDASHAELDRERAEIARVLGAFETVVSSPGESIQAPRRGARIGEVAHAVGVRSSALRVWEERGLLRPERERITGYRVYDEAELRNARVVALLRRAHYQLPIVHAVIDEIRATGSPERVRAELAKRERDLRRRSRLRLHASAALNAYLERFVPTGRVP